jgi:hypothetical protein
VLQDHHLGMPTLTKILSFFYQAFTEKSFMPAYNGVDYPITLVLESFR